MIYTTGAVREWLQEMRRFASRDADRASHLLMVLDDAERVNGHREEMGDYAYEQLVKFGLCIGDEPEPFIERLGQQNLALRDLCVDAGLLDKGDVTTDPIPLLRMFLPS